MTAREFVGQGHSIQTVLRSAGVAESTFYYAPRAGRRGRTATTTTNDANGRTWSEAEVVALIEEYLGQEFVDDGYVKVAKWLRKEHGLQINKKKVYRIMREYRLLNGRPERQASRRQWVDQLVPTPGNAFEHLEFDIKYMHIRGQRRNAMMLTVIDVKSRFVIGWLMQWSIKKEDVVALFQDVLRALPGVARIIVRSDNGSQFVSHMVREHFTRTGIEHEFTRPATPEQNAHIESYHSIVERVICKQYAFTDLRHANDVLTRWVAYYNHKRLHSGIGYIAPVEYLQANNASLPSIALTMARQTSFFIN